MGNRPVGRPRQRWQEDVTGDLKKKLKVKNWKETSKDRRTWRDMAENAKNWKETAKDRRTWRDMAENAKTHKGF